MQKDSGVGGSSNSMVSRNWLWTTGVSMIMILISGPESTSVQVLWYNEPWSWWHSCVPGVRWFRSHERVASQRTSLRIFPLFVLHVPILSRIDPKLSPGCIDHENSCKKAKIRSKLIDLHTYIYLITKSCFQPEYQGQWIYLDSLLVW